jgi:DNA-3-methyladenine glycosylase I
MQRCQWCSSHPLYLDYHDNEWGVPLHNDRKLFEMLILEGAQAGLSWLTVLKKRENYRSAMDGFDPEQIARYDDQEIARLLADEGIIRNRLKIASTITNARAFLQVCSSHGSFDQFIWQFVGGRPQQNSWKSLKDIPPKTAESDMMSKELRRLGVKFVGSTICYAFMQATGMVNDHTVDCFRHEEIRQLAT